MDNRPFWYIRDLLVDIDLYCSLRFGARLKVLGQIELVENLKVLFDVNKRKLSNWFLWFLIGGYSILLGFNKVGDLLSG